MLIDLGPVFVCLRMSSFICLFPCQVHPAHLTTLANVLNIPLSHANTGRVASRSQPRTT